VLVYVADALAAAFIVPHPDDYRALHATLVQDMYGELVHYYATLKAAAPRFDVRLTDDVASLADLRAAAVREQAEWARFHDLTMADALLGETYSTRRVYRMGDYTLSRFLPTFRLKEENHIGELITDRDGRTAYLKTFRLSEAQTRRGYLLSKLAAHDWHLETTATALGITVRQLDARLQAVGLGALLREDVRARYRAA
jgi:hypothetical protein